MRLDRLEAVQSVEVRRSHSFAANQSARGPGTTGRCAGPDGGAGLGAVSTP